MPLTPNQRSQLRSQAITLIERRLLLWLVDCECKRQGITRDDLMQKIIAPQIKGRIVTRYDQPDYPEKSKVFERLFRFYQGTEPDEDL